MRPVRLGAVVVGCLVVQLAVFVDVRVAGVAPELLALVAVVTGLRLGSEGGAVVGFAAGLLWDVYLPTPLGVAALAYGLAGHTAGLLAPGLHDEARWQRAGLGGLGSALAIVVYAVFGWILGHEGLLSWRLVPLVVVVGAIDAVVALVLDPLVGWALGAPVRTGGDGGRGRGRLPTWWTLRPRW